MGRPGMGRAEQPRPMDFTHSEPIYSFARWIVPMILLGTDVHARARERLYNALAMSLATLNSK